MISAVCSLVQVSAYRSIPARVNSRASARATARCVSADCRVPAGSAYHRYSCSRSSEMTPRPPPDVSDWSACLTSSATAGSSRARVLSASASVIMRSVCPTWSSDERCVADLTADVRVLWTSAPRLCAAARQSWSEQVLASPHPSHCLPDRWPMVQAAGRLRHDCGVSGIYDQPELYELACAYRDVPAEVTALQAWCATHFSGSAGAARSVLELAAGPAEHARELARRG